jgi:hypothetical protein
MTKRYFRVRVYGEAIVKLDQNVIDIVDDDWRESLYDLNTPEEIAGMIGYNMMCNKYSLSGLDGWADQPDSNAQFLRYPAWEVEDVIEVDRNGNEIE